MMCSPARIAILVADGNGSHLDVEGDQACEFRPDGIHVRCRALDEYHPWQEVRGLVVRVPASSLAGDDVGGMADLQGVTGGFRVTHPIVSIDSAVHGAGVVHLDAGPMRSFPGPAVDAMDAALQHLGGTGNLRLLGDADTARRIVEAAAGSRHWFTPLACRRVRRALRGVVAGGTG